MNQSGWERRKILIWGKTRPELSKKYREIVCTGGVFADTKRLVRLYPIALRYMDGDQQFKKYQWIEANVCSAKAHGDSRPESYRIAEQGIEVGKLIPSKNGDWDARAEWLLQPENMFASVEELKARQREDRTSLGLVAPAEVTKISAERVAPKEQDQFLARYYEAVSQMDLPLDPDTKREIKPLRPPDFRFKIEFRCNDSRCTAGHHCSVLDWEMDALYFRLRRDDTAEEAAKGVVEKLRSISDPGNDLRFFMGNIANHPSNFTIVGLWWPKRKTADPQLGLLFKP